MGIPSSPASAEVAATNNNDDDHDVINKWRNKQEWFCYWNKNRDNGNGDNHDDDCYVFQTQLVTSYCGVIRPLEWDYFTSLNSNSTSRSSDIRDMYDVMERILDIYQSVEYELIIGWGDEGTHFWQPILLPWNNNSDNHTVLQLSPRTLLDYLGAHEEIKSTICIRSWVFNDDNNNDVNNATENTKNKDGLQAIQDFLDQYENSIVFTAGDGKLSPVPCFAVAHIPKLNLIAGFIGGVTYT